MKINSPLYSNNLAESPSFKGGGRLTARFSKTLYDNNRYLMRLSDCYEKVADEKSIASIVGTLPPEFIKILKTKVQDKSKLAEKIKSTYSAFGELVKKLKGFNDFVPPSSKLREFSKDFTSNLQKIGLLGSKESVSLKYIGGGAYGNAYLIKSSKNNFLPKVIKTYTELIEWVPHPILRETNAATFIKKARGHKADNTNVTEFYFSDLNRNYMITEYSPNYKTPVTSFYYNRLGLRYEDWHPGNIINRKVIDMGGFWRCDEYSSLLDNPLRLRIAKKLMNIYSDELELYRTKIGQPQRARVNQPQKITLRKIYKSIKRSIKNLFKPSVENKSDKPAWQNVKLAFPRFVEAYNREYQKAINNKCPHANEVLKALNVIKGFVHTTALDLLEK